MNPSFRTRLRLALDVLFTPSIVVTHEHELPGGGVITGCRVTGDHSTGLNVADIDVGSIRIENCVAES